MTTTDSARHRRPASLWWLVLPIPLLIVSVAVLYGLDVDTVHESPELLAALNALFCSATGFLIAYLAARSYLLTRSRGVLLLGAGSLVFGLAYLVVGPLMVQPNEGITVHNTSILVAGALFVASAVCARMEREFERRRRGVPGIVALALLGALVFEALLISVTMIGLTPSYYLAESGPTILRQIVLSLGVVGSVAAGTLFVITKRRPPSRFHFMAGTGLWMIGIGLAALLLTKAAPGSPIAWIGRSGQWLGGLYLLAGVFALHSPGESWASSLETALRTAEDQFRNLVEAAPLAIFVQTHGRFAYVNRAAERLFGVSPAAPLVGQDVIERIHPDYRNLVRERIRGLNVEHRAVATVEEAIIAENGSRVDVDVSAVPFVYAGENGALVFLADITERKRTEMEARWFERILNDSLNEIYLFDAQTLRFVRVNQGARDNLGYTMEELKQMTPLDLKPSLDRQAFEKLVGPLRSGRAQRVVFHTEHRRKDGSLYPVEVHLQTTDQEPRPLFLAVILDITERREAEAKLKRSEEQLRQSQKMEAIGQLAGGIAHDFNNLLTAIIGYSDLLLRRDELAKSPVREDMQEIRQAAERASALTRQILAFSRRQALQPTLVSLNAVLLGMEPLLRRVLGEDIDLVTLLDPELANTEVDVHQFEQVLMNLAVNARDAMPSGGQLTLETRNIESSARSDPVSSQSQPGSYVMLAVSDTGVGMDPEILAHVFEPFFTTKEPGQGTGLGLSTVYGIVSQSGGSVTAYSEPGRGTCFKVYLPRATKPEAASTPQVPTASSLPGSGTILVVEDEEALRRLAARILGGLGYQVLTAATADEALAIVSEGGCPFDLLLTDVVLPGSMQGNDLARILLTARPDLAVVYMSGYTRNAIVHAGRLDDGVNYLEKPFAPDDLARKVREVLGG